MKQSLRLWALTFVLICVISAPVSAVDHDFGTMNYQGIIKDAGGNKVTGQYTIIFRLWDDSLDGSMVWTEQHTLDITDGTVCLVLGTINSLENLDWPAQFWMELEIQGDSDPMPRIRLTSVPYSMNSKRLQGFVPGHSSGQIPVSDGSLNTNLNADLLNGADRSAFVEEGEPNSITSGMIADDAVNFESIADGTIRFSNIHQNGASLGQIMKWNGSAWALGSDDAGGITCNTSLDCTSGDPALTLIQHGSGKTAIIQHDFAETYEPALNVAANHRGTAGKFEVSLTTNDNYAIYALTKGTGNAVYGESWGSDGVYGTSTANDAAGVYGTSSNEQGYGVAGWCSPGIAVYGYTVNGWAGYFDGDVYIAGTLTGGKSEVKIDHPLDPENKYLVHNSVLSPDLKTVYDGIAILNSNGEATVDLPKYFEALNRNFRYQLTCIGGYAQVYVAGEVGNNQFAIAGGRPGMKVSWQVTGIRKDAFAEANHTDVEIEKSAGEKGRYIHPEAFGLDDEYGIDFERHTGFIKRAHKE